MYLARTLRWEGREAEMVGILPASVLMHERPMGRGYVQLEETSEHPWPGEPGQTVFPAHEFHYSALETPLPPDLRFAYRVHRGTGVNGRFDGIVHRNLLASYAHLRDTSHNHWAGRFVQFVYAWLLTFTRSRFMFTVTPAAAEQIIKSAREGQIARPTAASSTPWALPTRPPRTI